MAYYILKSYKLKVKPFQIFAVLSQEKNCFFLDSSLNSNPLGRYSFLGINPFYILKTKNENPFPKLRELLDKYKIDVSKNNPPFAGGAVGYLSYDLGLILEKKVKSRPKEDLKIPDCFFAFYNTIVTIDHLKQLLYIFSVGFPETNYRAAKYLCESNFKKIYNLVSGVELYRNNNKKYLPKNNSEELKSDFAKQEYIAAIRKAKEYIKRGDIYQVNLSQRFQVKTGLPNFEIYKRLRKISPSYFSAYFDAGDHQILSSSPERFLRLEDDIATTRPMKGTRPRGENRTEDTFFKKNLLESAKDKAELMMIVDLERNDLGRVCNYDSVRVTSLRELEEYSTVFQTTATVCGRLHKNKDRIDLLRACFPGGSITGCPKIRAMEIIEELEPTRRSVYTGCLGYISFSGELDFNILIRSILKKDDMLYFGVGGGIVADSNPEEEYQETLIKAKAMIAAISGDANGRNSFFKW
jgi:para-aminobenzoate synthetase component 1